VDRTADGDVTMTQDGSVQDEKEKDVGDAFELSQLLFVVGHVAIKHIVSENIVEKLCHRFRLSEDPRQWRDIAFCLSLLLFKSERSVKKLIEGLQFYRDKLHEETVFTRFTEILAKV
jgi:hypothetical protein